MGILFPRALSCYVRNMTVLRLPYREQAQANYMERVYGKTNSVMYLEGEEGGRKRQKPRQPPAFQLLVSSVIPAEILGIIKKR